MELSTRPKVIFLDSNSDLFDQKNSPRSTFYAVKKYYDELLVMKIRQLKDTHRRALRLAYRYHFNRQMIDEEADDETEENRKMLLFGSRAELEKSFDEDEEVHDVHKLRQEMREKEQRTIPGSIETLYRLRENGYRIIIISNGEIEDEKSKAKTIGICHLVDGIITSEEAGYSKPDRRIFHYAIEKYGAPLYTTYMVGSFADIDVKGALDAQLRPILYSQSVFDSEIPIYGQNVPIINHISQVLDHLKIQVHQFEPSFSSSPSQLVIKRMGIDLVTEPRHISHVSKNAVRRLMEKIGLVLVNSSNKLYMHAICDVGDMITEIEMAANIIDQPTSTTENEDDLAIIILGCEIFERDHSIYAEYVSLSLKVDTSKRVEIQDIALLLQRHCNSLMDYDPEMAIRELRSTITLLSQMRSSEMRKRPWSEALGDKF